MRLSRMKKRKKKQKELRMYYILFFIVLPLTALVIGYFIAKYIIVPIYFP